jgi:hypothetical protein
MRDDQRGDGDRPQITLLAINQTYWLYEGEDFLDEMLFGAGGYPVPVRCLVFRDAFELNLFIGEGRMLTKMWGINPDIVDRLRRDDHLVEMPGRAAG